MTQYAFIFPGQGSQSVGMLAELANSNSLVSQTFAEASAVLGYDLWQLVQNGPFEKLNQTEFTQAAMLCADVAVYRVLVQQGMQMPEFMAGHSLGEYAALVCSEAISLQDAAILVAARGRIMQETVPMGVGSMAAIVGLDDAKVLSICLESSTTQEQVSPANFNAIGQVVIAGHTAAVLRALQLAEQQEARLAKIIPVSVPCHCALLMKAAQIFAEHLAQAPFKTPLCSVVSNVNLAIYKTPAQIRELLTEQLYQPVRWVETIQLMGKQGVDTLVECGPGKVLSGLTKRIDKNLTAISAYDPPSIASTVALITHVEYN